MGFWLALVVGSLRLVLVVAAPWDIAPARAEAPLLKEQLQAWREDGFLVLRSFARKGLVRECRHFIESVLWNQRLTSRPQLNGTIVFPVIRTWELRKRREQKILRNLTYYLNLGLLRKLPRHNCFARLAYDHRMLAVASQLVEGPIGNLHSLSGLLFERGSQQWLHADSWYGLHGEKPGGTIGVWFAFDQVDDENGPLMVVKGSHKQKLNFSAWKRNHRRLRQAEHVHAEPGDVVIWGESVLHGGARIVNWNRKRRSFITWYRDTEVPMKAEAYN